MTLHTVSTGENLWKICKNKFKLTNNTDIANKVNEIAQKNNIKNPDMIFAGQKLDLSVGDTLVKSKEVQETAETKTKAVTSNPITQDQHQENTQAVVAAKQKIQLSNIENYEQMNNLTKSSVSIFSKDTKTSEQQKQAYIQYSEQLLKEYYDVDGDGKVTTQEFAQVETNHCNKVFEIQKEKIDDDAIKECETNSELKDLLNFYDKDNDGKISKEEYKIGMAALGTPVDANKEIYSIMAQRTGNLFAKNLDMNGDGTISKEELAFFNETADSIDGQKDGVISAASESNMFQSVTGMNVDNKEINAVVNKYLLGETLTAEEQKILDNSSITIRSAMSKAAGFTTEEQ